MPVPRDCKPHMYGICAFNSGLYLQSIIKHIETCKHIHSTRAKRLCLLADFQFLKGAWLLIK